MVIPKTDVNLATEVRDVLTQYGGTVSDYLPSFFTTAAKINKWSKHKPVKYRADFPLYDDEYDKLYNDKLYWWKAYNGLCGFVWSSVEFNTLDDLIYAYNNDRTFVYELPTGGSQYPYRLGDFREYYPDAKSPVYSFKITGGQMIQNAWDTYYEFTVLGNQDVNSQYNLTLQDISPDDTDFTLSTWFFGVIISDGKTHFIKKSDDFIGDDVDWTQTVKVTLRDMADKAMANPGQYIAYPVITNSTSKRFIACDVPAVSFSVIIDPAEAKVGWMTEPEPYCKFKNGALHFYATLSWHSDYENSTFTFESYVIRKTGLKETIRVESGITPVKNSQNENDPDVYYMNIGDSPYLSMANKVEYTDGDVFYLSVAYANSTGSTITDVIDCGEPVDVTPE